MSGVFGVVDPNRQVHISILSSTMAKAMSHRDWYVAESFIDDEYNLTLGRIGIGIFNKISQPVWNSSGTVALVMAGEFYDTDSSQQNI